MSNNFIPQITLPAKITETTATLIDNILISSNVLNCISGNINISTPDHLPQLIVLDTLLGSSTDEDSSQIFYRNFKPIKLTKVQFFLVHKEGYEGDNNFCI